MTEDPARSIPRHELIADALAAGVDRPESMSSTELVAALSAAQPRPVATGWFGVARYLVANVVEQGLNLPQAARAIRNAGSHAHVTHRAPLPTVTLAQIYLAQGHSERARSTLEEVVRRDPDNQKAQVLLNGLAWPGQAAVPDGADPAIGPPLPVRSESFAGAPKRRAFDALLERDQVVILSGELSTYVCWELSSASASRGRVGDLSLVIKVFSPAHTTPRIRTEIVPLRHSNGAHRVELEGGDCVRAALMRVEGARTRAFRVASEYACRPGSKPDLLWEPRKGTGGAAQESAERAAGQLFT